jgi:hypothetical protein
MNQAFLDYYRCPREFADFRPAAGLLDGNPSRPFGAHADPAKAVKSGVHGEEHHGRLNVGTLRQLQVAESTRFLSFDPTAVADHLRYERYAGRAEEPSWKRALRELYYWLRPALPVAVRRHLQRLWLKGWDKKPFPSWPVDMTVDRMFERLMAASLRAGSSARIPFVWFWPEGKSSCAIMTHDVETAVGLEFAGALMDMNDAFSIKSSFQIVPEQRYIASDAVLSAIRSRGFEINVHDLKHDGRLFEDHGQFLQSAAKINQHARRLGSTGFRSAVLYRNLDWYSEFSFSYDMSVPNVAHLDPQPGGCCTVMPYFIGNILELPVTTTQDYSLFKILGTYSLDLWRQQIRQVMQQHGLISFIVHPDYLDSHEARSTYLALLGHLAELRAEAGVWIPLPGEVDTWWRQRSEMKLVPDGDRWHVEGVGSERARVAYATLEKDQVIYVFG